MQRILKSDKGFTLVEVILAMAILGIIVVVFLNVFTSGAMTIFNAGHKSSSNVEAQAIIDRIYEETDSKIFATLSTEIETILEEEVGTGNYISYTSNISDFNEPYENNYKIVRYYLKNETLLSGSSVPVLVFRMYYKNGKKTVNITTPLSK
jgi:prepilin-type N-terminal cleavage/methylation domain-containing protein